MNNKERKKMMKALRSMILRYRKQKKSDETAIATFCYEKGLTKKDVEEMYQILIEAQRIPYYPWQKETEKTPRIEPTLPVEIIKTE